MRSSKLPKPSLKQRLFHAWQRLRGGEMSPRRAGLSVALGLLVGLSPAYGLHLPLAVAVCLPFRLDATLAYAATCISNPLTLPFLLGAEAHVGALLLSQPVVDPSNLSLTTALGQIAVGALVMGPAVAVLGGLLTAALVHLKQRRDAFADQRARAADRLEECLPSLESIPVPVDRG